MAVRIGVDLMALIDPLAAVAVHSEKI